MLCDPEVEVFKCVRLSSLHEWRAGKAAHKRRWKPPVTSCKDLAYLCPGAELRRCTGRPDHHGGADPRHYSCGAPPMEPPSQARKVLRVRSRQLLRGVTAGSSWRPKGRHMVRHDMTKPLPHGMAIFLGITRLDHRTYTVRPVGTMDANVNGCANCWTIRGRSSQASTQGFCFLQSEIYGDPTRAHPDPRGLPRLRFCPASVCYDEASDTARPCATSPQHGLR